MSYLLQITPYVVHSTAVFQQKILWMLQVFVLEFCNGLGRIDTTEGDLFWQALASLKDLWTFAMELNGDRQSNASGRELLNSVSMLTQIGWVTACPKVLKLSFAQALSAIVPESLLSKVMSLGFMLGEYNLDWSW